MIRRISLAFVALAAAGCASPGGQFTSHTPGGLRQEGPSSSDSSIYMQDGTMDIPASSSLQGGYGPSRVVADVQGVSAASTLSQNTGTVRLPYDLNRDGVLGDGEIVVLNVSGTSDFAVGEVQFTYYDDQNKPLSTVSVRNVSSINSAVATATVPIVAEHVKAYMAASADRREEYNRYMETAQVLIKEGRMLASDAMAMGLKILTGGAAVPVP